MKELGFRAGKNYSSAMQRIKNIAGETVAERVDQLVQERANGKRNDEVFYAYKNQSQQLSMTITNAFDSDILRKACDWIAKNQDCFGDTILEVGCDCGIMTCFLAKTFPNAQITAIDKCTAGIENAKKLAKKLGITNVTFIVCALTEVPDKYDTVFCMRTLRENVDLKEDILNDITVQADIFKPTVSAYIRQLHEKTKNAGNLIFIEKMNLDALFLSVITALKEDNMMINLRNQQNIKCNELGHETHIQAFSVTAFETDILHDETMEADNDETSQEITPFELFTYACRKELNFDLSLYFGWNAKIVYEAKRGELITGYKVKSTDPFTKAVYTLWTHKYDPTGLLSYENINGNVRLGFMDISEKDRMILQLKNVLNQAKHQNPFLMIEELKDTNKE